MKPEKETCIAWSDSCSCVAVIIWYMQRTISEAEQPKFPISCLPVLDNESPSVIEKNKQKETANKEEVFIFWDIAPCSQLQTALRYIPADGIFRVFTLIGLRWGYVSVANVRQ
jgi:hypothetical protein